MKNMERKGGAGRRVALWRKVLAGLLAALAVTAGTLGTAVAAEPEAARSGGAAASRLADDYGLTTHSEAGENSDNHNLFHFFSGGSIKDEKNQDVVGGTLYVGEKYHIHLDFKEGGALGRQFTPLNDCLYYELPKSFKAEAQGELPLYVTIDDERVEVGTYSVTDDGFIIISLTPEGEKALDSSRDVSLSFDLDVTATNADGSEDGNIKFGDTGTEFEYKITDRSAFSVEKEGHYQENEEKTGGLLNYSVKTTVEHGKVYDLEMTDTLTPPETDALVLDMVKEKAGDSVPKTVVTLKRAGSDETLTLDPEDYELIPVEPDPDNPKQQSFRVELTEEGKGKYNPLYKGDELTVTYSYQVDYQKNAVGTLWGNVVNEVTVNGQMPVKGEDGQETDRTPITETRGSQVEVWATSPGHGVIYKTQEYSEAEKKIHYTLYTLVPAGDWTPFYIQDDMVVEFGGEKYNLQEFKENGRVKDLKVSAVDVENWFNWDESTGDPDKIHDLAKLKEQAHELKGYDMYHVWNYSPEGYDPNSVKNCIRLWNNNNLDIIFGNWEFGKQDSFGNWKYSQDRLIITEYDLDMSDGVLELINTSDYRTTIEKNASEVLLAGIRNTVYMRFGSYNPGYAVFFNNAEKMNKTGAPTPNADTVDYTVTMNTTDSTVWGYFLDVKEDIMKNGEKFNWGSGYYEATMQAVFYDVLPEGWEYVSHTLYATAYYNTGTSSQKIPYRTNLPDPCTTNEEGRKVISAPLAYFYDDINTNLPEKGLFPDLFNAFSEKLVKLVFQYQIRPTKEWLADHATDPTAVILKNHAEIKDKYHTHWQADAEVPYFAPRLTKTGKQVAEGSYQMEFTLNVNPNGKEFIQENMKEAQPYLIVQDASSSLQILTDTIQVSTADGHPLKKVDPVPDEKVKDIKEWSKDEWAVIPTGEEGAFRLLVPNRVALTIQYQAVIPEAGENVKISNTAEILGVAQADTGVDEYLHVNDVTGGGTGHTYELTFKKVDADAPARALSGAKFQFYIVLPEGKETELVKTKDITIGGKKYACHTETNWVMVTGDDGQCKIEKESNWPLEPGNYYILEEIDAPAGYDKLEEPVLFYYGQTKDGVEQETGVEYVPLDGVLTVADPPTVYELPESGGSGTLGLYMLGGALLAAAGTALLCENRRKGARR